MNLQIMNFVKEIDMAKMYLMSGMSGSGKTTFAKKFAEEHSLLYLCPDDFYKIFNGDERIHENEFEVWIALFQAIHIAEMNGIDCIIDTNAPTVVDRTQFINWFPSFEHHLIAISAPLELCCENNKNRKRIIPQEHMLEMWYTFQLPMRGGDEDWRWKSLIIYHNENNTGFKKVSSG